MFTASMLITLGKQDLIHSGLDLQFRMLRLFFYITSTFSLVKKKTCATINVERILLCQSGVVI